MERLALDGIHAYIGCMPTITQPVVLLAPQHAAKRLGLSVSRLVQFDREGVFCALRDSAGRRLYDPQAVERFAAERQARKDAE